MTRLVHWHMYRFPFFASIFFSIAAVSKRSCCYISGLPLRSCRLWPDGFPRVSVPIIIGSVAYWCCIEVSGYGDLRQYALVQFLPIALIPTILLLFKRSYLNGLLLLSALALYFVAKACEHFDQQLFYSIGIA